MDATLPLWVNILVALGIPSLLGVLAGSASSYFLFRLQSKKENRRDREDIAKNILSEVYSYNVTATNELINLVKEDLSRADRDKSNQRLVAATASYNQAEALADLMVNEAAADSLKAIKSTIKSMADEIIGKLQAGVQSGTRDDLPSGKIYKKEVYKLKRILKEWVDS